MIHKYAKNTIANWLDSDRKNDVVCAHYSTVERLWCKYDQEGEVTDLDAFIHSLVSVELSLEDDEVREYISFGGFWGSIKNESDGKNALSVIINRGLCERLKMFLDFLLSIPNEEDAEKWFKECYKILSKKGGEG